MLYPFGERNVSQCDWRNCPRPFNAICRTPKHAMLMHEPEEHHLLSLRDRLRELAIMTPSIDAEITKSIQIDDRVSLEYTRVAYSLLPGLQRPRILDIGCGRGVVTLELARLGAKKVVGIDIDPAALQELAERCEHEGLGDHVQPVLGSMFSMGFCRESFDALWSEGSIQFMGFEAGLRSWRRLLKEDGFLVVHVITLLDDNPPEGVFTQGRGVYQSARLADDYVSSIPEFGYTLLEVAPLPSEVWWHDYYGPLEACLDRLSEQYAGDEAILRALNQRRDEVAFFKTYHRWIGSAFYIMQKTRKPK
jgi:SAM-dependent methyltransferase